MAESFLHGVEVLELTSGSRPIQTVASSVIGIVGTAPFADASAFPLNTPVLIAGSRVEAAKLVTGMATQDTGTLPKAVDAILDQAGAVIVVIRVEKGATDVDSTNNVIGGVDGVTGKYNGMQALLGAKSTLDVVPRILIAPGFTHQRGEKTSNAVVGKLITIAERLRAVIIADGPNTTDAAATSYSGDFGSPRVFVVDPWVLRQSGKTIEAQPASGCIAGLIAKSDNDRGFWWSPSNMEINGIVGTSRPIDFSLGDTSSRANLLNASKIATIIRESGYRLWGNRTLSSDPKWAFLSVRRTADMINDSVLRAHMWAVDRNINKNYVKDVTEGVNAYLRHLKAIGAILGGTCWAPSELNTTSEIEKGNVYFDFDFTAPTPAEHITFRSLMTNEYYKEVL